MNIGVYVSSQYDDYYEFSKRLSSALKRYTNSPVLLGICSNTKKTGYDLLRRYAEEHHVHLKTYTAEWRRRDSKRFVGKRGQSLGGVIAIYHCVRNSERTIAFNSGGKGTASFIRMSRRLKRPCDVISVNPFAKHAEPPSERHEEKGLSPSHTAGQKDLRSTQGAMSPNQSNGNMPQKGGDTQSATTPQTAASSQSSPRQSVNG